jgi:preprotein translocase subunit SecA
MNQQREVIYDLRSFALEGGEDLKGEAWDMIEKTLDRLLEEHAPEGVHSEEWDLHELRNRLLLDFFVSADQLPQEEGAESDFHSRDELREYLVGLARGKFNGQLSQFGTHSESLLRYVVLSTIDERWKDHLYDLDHLKASIGFRGWGQKDPLIEYKREAFDMFVDLLTDIQSSIARLSSVPAWRPRRRRCRRSTATSCTRAPVAKRATRAPARRSDRRPPRAGSAWASTRWPPCAPRSPSR